MKREIKDFVIIFTIIFSLFVLASIFMFLIGISTEEKITFPIDSITTNNFEISYIVADGYRCWFEDEKNIKCELIN